MGWHFFYKEENKWQVRQVRETSNDLKSPPIPVATWFRTAKHQGKRAGFGLVMDNVLSGAEVRSLDKSCSELPSLRCIEKHGLQGGF